MFMFMFMFIGRLLSLLIFCLLLLSRDELVRAVRGLSSNGSLEFFLSRLNRLACLFLPQGRLLYRLLVPVPPSAYGSAPLLLRQEIAGCVPRQYMREQLFPSGEQ